MGILKHFPENVSRDTRKVYFSCHKDDFDLYFKAIKNEITKGRNCAVFYDADYDGDRDEQFLFDLSQMSLFVMPITTRLLTKPNRAFGEELAFAIEHKIPILPLMQESGLEELYKQKFGDLQFLDKTEQDKTALSYEEKLDKYLSSILLNDETIKRIRDEFDAQIFLSYRKKDRIHANRLMRLIHKNEFLRDVAIWYDEFLTPGENFNDNIRKALDKSGLFVLAVTPSLLESRIDEEGIEHKNYIEEHEYPMAKERESEGKIAILPAELVKTDNVLLSQKYENIPDCVDSDDENALTEALLATAKKLVNDENDNSPEHNYLIGLAYLNGIDVEVDHARAFEMIEYAANCDNIEAIDKIIEMHSNGRGVWRNQESAIKWHERKIAVIKKLYDENPNENNAEIYFWVLIKCGDEYLSKGDSSEAMAKYSCATAFYESIVKRTYSMRRNQAIIYNRIGNVYESQGNIVEAKNRYDLALEITEQLATEMNTEQARLDVAISFNRQGNIYEAIGDLDEARKCYLKSLEIAERLAKETNTIKARRALSVSYSYIGDVYKIEENTREAKKYYEKSLAISERLVAETDTIEARRDLAVSHTSLGDVYEAEGNAKDAKIHYEAAVQIFEELATETQTVLARGDLSVGYGNLGGIYEAAEIEDEARTYYLKSLKIAEEIVIETKTANAWYAYAVALYKVAAVSYGDIQLGYLQKAVKILNWLCETCPNVAVYQQHRQFMQIILDSITEN